jgi:hypothetical protein
MALKDALSKLNKAVEDLTSLHVQTFTGTVNLEVGNDDFDTLKQQLKKASEGSNVTLVAESYFKFDGDSYNFITNKTDDVPSSALEMHTNAIKAGIETRQGLLNMFKKALKLD